MVDRNLSLAALCLLTLLVAQSALRSQEGLDPDDYYPVPGAHAVVDFGPVHVWQAQTRTGSLPLSIQDCYRDRGDNELFIRSSPEYAAPPVTFGFRSVCAPNVHASSVELRYTQGSKTATWRALTLDGTVVDQAQTTATDRLATLQLKGMESVVRVEVVGDEICIDRICTGCDVRVDPAVDADDCVSAQEYYDDPQEVTEAQFGPLTVFAPGDNNGVSQPMQIVDCDEDSLLNLVILSNHPPFPATITPPANACDDLIGYPRTLTVDIVGAAGTVFFRVFDPAGTYLMTESVAGPAVAVFSHPAGIRRVQVFGDEICIGRICWDCEVRQAAPEPGDCVSADSSYNVAQDLSAVAQLGDIQVTPSGSPVPLHVDDCDQDGSLNLFIHSSPPAAPATMIIPRSCPAPTPFPQTVEIEVVSVPATAFFHVYGPTGTWLTTVSVTGSGTAVISHTNGIRRIEVIGNEIYLGRVCRKCELTKTESQLIARFQRGDSDGDGEKNLTDGVKVLTFLFLGDFAPPPAWTRQTPTTPEPFSSTTPSPSSPPFSSAARHPSVATNATKTSRPTASDAKPTIPATSDRRGRAPNSAEEGDPGRATHIEDHPKQC